MSKAVNSQKALQWLATTTGKGEGGGVAIMVQPQAGKHITVRLAGKDGDSQQIRVLGDTGKRLQLNA